MPDSQRQKVYDSELVLRQIYDWAVQADSHAVTIAGVSMTLPPEAKFGSLESIQAYCDRVTTLIGARPVRVRARKGDRAAHYERATGVIAVCPEGRRWAMRELVVLHELAHHVSPGGHGPEFVSAFIDLMTVVMGAEVGLAMRLICADGDVKEAVGA